MTSKSVKRAMRAAAKREFTVYLRPMNGGNLKAIKGVVAYTSDLACWKVNQENPGFIATGARPTKVLLPKDTTDV